MADEKSPADEDVMKDTADASEIQNEELDDDATQDDEQEEIDTSDDSADLDDGDSASLETQVEELKEAEQAGDGVGHRHIVHGGHARCDLVEGKSLLALGAEAEPCK